MDTFRVLLSCSHLFICTVNPLDALGVEIAKAFNQKNRSYPNYLPSRLTWHTTLRLRSLSQPRQYSFEAGCRREKSLENLERLCSSPPSPADSCGRIGLLSPPKDQ